MTSDWQRERRNLQAVVAERAVSLEMLEETYQQAMALARENGWSESEALRIVFANGLAFLRAQQELGRLERSDLPEQALEELNKTVRQLMEESSRYASLKFKAFRMSQDNEALEMREAALQTENAMMKSRIDTFREDEDRLKSRIRELEAEVAAMRREHEVASSNGAETTRQPAPILSGAAWRVERPPTAREEELGPHTWAENLLPRIPYRFQRYVEELLFDDERILYFLHRPSFRLKRGVRSWLHSPENEGLLLVTDRMAMFLEDASPPDATMVRWGYRVVVTAAERIRDVRILRGDAAVELRIAAGRASKPHVITVAFPMSHRAELHSVLLLMNGFCKTKRTLPRRIYPAAPCWEPFDVRMRRLRLEGAPPGEVAEQDKELIEAVCGDATVSLKGEVLALRRGGEEIVLDAARVATVELLRGLVGCRFTVRWIDDGSPAEWSCRFEYPQSGDFLSLLSRLRHLMGQPEAGQRTALGWGSGRAD